MTKQQMKKKGFRIEVSSRYDGFWRYNVALTCGCFDAEGNRTEFVTASSHVADVGSNLAQRPADLPEERTVVLSTEPCESLLGYLYIIPHSLPAANDIDAARPFDIALNVFCNGRRIRSERRAVNQWSGASIELKFDASEKV